jgi:C1A family cysteine protease
MDNISNQIPKSTYDIRDYTITSGIEFPKTFSLDILPPIKNQWLQSTCTAHALASAVEYYHQKQHGFYVPFSTEFIYGVRENDCYIGEGMRIRDGLNTLVKYGDVYEEDCKGNHNCNQAMKNISQDFDRLKELAYPHRISGYFRINTNDELKTALMNHGVVVVNMNVYSGLRLVNDVYTPFKTSKKEGAHCVFIYGWNEKGWLVQNSWGKFYGWDGRFIIPFDFKFNEIWGITDNITDGNIIKPKNNKWLNIIYKVINKIVNMFNKTK